MLIYYQNVNRFRSKTKEFYLNVLNNEYDIICLTETNLNSTIFDGELIDTRYNVVRRDRYQSNVRKAEGGGILIAVKKEINFIHQDSWNSELEDLWISILPKTTNVKIINICLCYLPPDLPLDCIDKFYTNCPNVIMRYRNTEEFLCIGDFNTPDVHWSKSSQYNYMIPLHPRGQKANLLCDTLRICNLDNYNSIPNSDGRFLDLILFSSNSIQVYEVQPLSRLDHHHPSLVADVNFVEINSNNFKNKNLKRPNLFKSNFPKINLELKSVEWHNILSTHEDIDSMTDAFYAGVRNIITKHTPMTKSDTNIYPVWFTPALKQSLKEKRKYHRRFKKYKNPRDYDTFSMLRNRCKKLISNDYKNFVSSVESSLDDDIKFFWRFVNDKKNNSNSIPKTMKYGNHI
ncbi:unnamed protein product [Parnassius mnemosyne]|uniref:Endonuclease/exonuclease/phosphatase domain-containing protein n=1 Tax=Parnassius mnemosyne TaxID=213953 RepID=A0AAV1KV53_9NEOP